MEDPDDFEAETSRTAESKTGDVISVNIRTFGTTSPSPTSPESPASPAVPQRAAPRPGRRISQRLPQRNSQRLSQRASQAVINVSTSSAAPSPACGTRLPERMSSRQAGMQRATSPSNAQKQPAVQRPTNPTGVSPTLVSSRPPSANGAVFKPPGILPMDSGPADIISIVCSSCTRSTPDGWKGVRCGHIICTECLVSVSNNMIHCQMCVTLCYQDGDHRSCYVCVGCDLFCRCDDKKPLRDDEAVPLAGKVQRKSMEYYRKISIDMSSANVGDAKGNIGMDGGFQMRNQGKREVRDFAASPPRSAGDFEQKLRTMWYRQRRFDRRIMVLEEAFDDMHKQLEVVRAQSFQQQQQHSPFPGFQQPPLFNPFQPGMQNMNGSPYWNPSGGMFWNAGEQQGVQPPADDVKDGDTSMLKPKAIMAVFQIKDQTGVDAGMDVSKNELSIVLEDEVKVKEITESDELSNSVDAPETTRRASRGRGRSSERDRQRRYSDEPLEERYGEYGGRCSRDEDRNRRISRDRRYDEDERRREDYERKDVRRRSERLDERANGRYVGDEGRDSRKANGDRPQSRRYNDREDDTDTSTSCCKQTSDGSEQNKQKDTKTSEAMDLFVKQLAALQEKVSSLEKENIRLKDEQLTLEKANGKLRNDFKEFAERQVEKAEKAARHKSKQQSASAATENAGSPFCVRPTSSQLLLQQIVMQDGNPLHRQQMQLDVPLSPDGAASIQPQIYINDGRRVVKGWPGQSNEKDDDSSSSSTSDETTSTSTTMDKKDKIRGRTNITMRGGPGQGFAVVSSITQVPVVGFTGTHQYPPPNMHPMDPSQYSKRTNSLPCQPLGNRDTELEKCKKRMDDLCQWYRTCRRKEVFLEQTTLSYLKNLGSSCHFLDDVNIFHWDVDNVSKLHLGKDSFKDFRVFSGPIIDMSCKGLFRFVIDPMPMNINVYVEILMSAKPDKEKKYKVKINSFYTEQAFHERVYTAEDLFGFKGVFSYPCTPCLGFFSVMVAIDYKPSPADDMFDDKLSIQLSKV